MIFRSPNIAFFAAFKRGLGAKGAKGVFQGAEKKPSKSFIETKVQKVQKKLFFYT